MNKFCIKQRKNSYNFAIEQNKTNKHIKQLEY